MKNPINFRVGDKVKVIKIIKQNIFSDKKSLNLFSKCIGKTFKVIQVFDEMIVLDSEKITKHSGNFFLEEIKLVKSAKCSKWKKAWKE